MSIRLRAMAILAASSVLAGCAAGPVSQATTLPASVLPSMATPGDGASPAATVPPASAAGTPVPASGAAASAPAPTDVPPKPGDTTWSLVKETPKAGGGATVEHEITWTSPDGAASEFLVYGVTDCLRYAKKYDGTPCLVRGMPIPRSVLKLIGRAPGDARSITVSWDVGAIGPGPYHAILIRGTNSVGDSIFTIVHSEDVCYGCTS